MMFDKILIPTDGSATAGKAARKGLELAKNLGSKVTFLHALENPLVAGYAAPEALPYSAQLYEDLKQAAEGILEDAKALGDKHGVKVDTKLVENRRPADAIHDLEDDYDLVILGTHGRRGVDRWMFGSVAEAAVRRSSQPYLLIRSDEEIEMHERDKEEAQEEGRGA